MESRMEKYYRDDLSTFERTKKNEKLYKDVSSQISDLDNLPIPDNANEIDVNGLKNIISSRDEYRKAKELGRTFVSNRPRMEEEIKIRDKNENKIYDINVLLENASSGRFIITTDNPGCRETVNDKVTGYIYKCNDILRVCKIRND